LAWHFLAKDGRLCTHNGMAKWRDTKVRPGVTYVHRGPIEMCLHGLHACESPLDALLNAPGPIACRVECWDRLEKENDPYCSGISKLVCGHRKVLWMCNASKALRKFAVMNADYALDSAFCVDNRSRAAVEAARAQLKGSMTKSDMKIYAAAARDAEKAMYKKYTSGFNTADEINHLAAGAASDVTSYEQPHAAAIATVYAVLKIHEKLSRIAPLSSQLRQTLLEAQAHDLSEMLDELEPWGWGFSHRGSTRTWERPGRCA